MTATPSSIITTMAVAQSHQSRRSIWRSLAWTASRLGMDSLRGASLRFSSPLSGKRGLQFVGAIDPIPGRVAQTYRAQISPEGHSCSLSTPNRQNSKKL